MTLAEFLRLYPYTPAVVAAIILLICLRIWGRRLVWKLFSFDEEIAKITSQKKSSEVRIGRIAETLAPMLDSFPVDIHKEGTITVLLGQPVDFIHFDPDEGITFIEVKSGESELSASQKRLRRLVQGGKVRWIDFRVK